MTVSERCQSFVADIRRKLKSLTDKYPALVLLCGLINGLLPMTLMPDKPATIKILYCLPALLTVFLLPLARAWTFAILTLAGIASVEIYLRTLDDGFLAITGERDCGAETIVRISDASCGGDTVPWMQNPPLLRAEILQIRLNGEPEWRKTSGRTALFLPKDHGTVNYGDVLRLRGVFRKAESSILEESQTVFPEKFGRAPEKQPLHKTFPGNFDFHKYLLSRGIVRTFHASEAVALHGYEQFSLLGKLLDFRNVLVASSTAGMEKTESKSMLAILLFGSYMLFTLAVAFAPNFLATPVFGNTTLALPQLQSQALRVLRWVLPDVRALVALQAGEVDDEARSQGVAAAGQ